MAEETPAIGIDLGTTSCSVAVLQNGLVEIIANEQGSRTTPSCVSFISTGCLIGEPALKAASHNPQNTIYDVKRILGRRFDDVTLQADMKLWPFKVINHQGLNSSFCLCIITILFLIMCNRQMQN